MKLRWLMRQGRHHNLCNNDMIAQCGKVRVWLIFQILCWDDFKSKQNPQAAILQSHSNQSRFLSSVWRTCSGKLCNSKWFGRKFFINIQLSCLVLLSISLMKHGNWIWDNTSVNIIHITVQLVSPKYLQGISSLILLVGISLLIYLYWLLTKTKFKESLHLWKIIAREITNDIFHWNNRVQYPQGEYATDKLGIACKLRKPTSSHQPRAKIIIR